MIRTILAQVQWGVEPTPDGGVQFNFLDPDSGQVFHIPFGPEPLVEVFEKLSENISEEVRAQVKDFFTSNGIAIPGRDFDPSQIKPGPQG